MNTVSATAMATQMGPSDNTNVCWFIALNVDPNVECFICCVSSAMVLFRGGIPTQHQESKRMQMEKIK